MREASSKRPVDSPDLSPLIYKTARVRVAVVASEQSVATGDGRRAGHFFLGCLVQTHQYRMSTAADPDTIARYVKNVDALDVVSLRRIAVASGVPADRLFSEHHGRYSLVTGRAKLMDQVLGGNVPANAWTIAITAAVGLPGLALLALQMANGMFNAQLLARHDYFTHLVEYLKTNYKGREPEAEVPEVIPAGGWAVLTVFVLLVAEKCIRDPLMRKRVSAASSTRSAAHSDPIPTVWREYDGESLKYVDAELHAVLKHEAKEAKEASTKASSEARMAALQAALLGQVAWERGTGGGGSRRTLVAAHLFRADGSERRSPGEVAAAILHFNQAGVLASLTRAMPKRFRRRASEPAEPALPKATATGWLIVPTSAQRGAYIRAQLGPALMAKIGGRSIGLCWGWSAASDADAPRRAEQRQRLIQSYADGLEDSLAIVQMDSDDSNPLNAGLPWIEGMVDETTGYNIYDACGCAADELEGLAAVLRPSGEIAAVGSDVAVRLLDEHSRALPQCRTCPRCRSRTPTARFRRASTRPTACALRWVSSHSLRAVAAAHSQRRRRPQRTVLSAPLPWRRSRPRRPCATSWTTHAGSGCCTKS